jgi:hypothetical protein
VSAAFLRTLAGGSFPMVSRATLCNVYQTTVTPLGTRLPIVGGQVELSATSDTRGTSDITVIAPWPRSRNDLLAPYGNEIYIERGIKYDDGNVEYVGFGYFRVETVEQSDDPNTTSLRVTGVDRMQGIIEARMVSPRQFLAGSTFGALVSNLITEIYPGAVIVWDDNTNAATLTRDVLVDDDRYGFLNDAISSRGKIWYWDQAGQLTIKNVPDTTNAVYSVTNGRNGVLVKSNRSLSRKGAINAYVANGEGPDQQLPVTGVAVDNDPLSPTYYFGAFGKIPQFYSSQFLTTSAQCVAAAKALLTRSLGIPSDLDFGTIVNPALEPYDPVAVKLSHNDAQVTHILDTITIPLGESESMTCKTRERYVTLP